MSKQKADNRLQSTDYRFVAGQMKNYRPRTKEQLRNYVKAFMGISIPDKSMCASHASPMDYLWHSFNERQPSAVCRLPQNRSRAAEATGYDSEFQMTTPRTSRGANELLTVNTNDDAKTAVSPLIYSGGYNQNSISCRVACAPRFHLPDNNQIKIREDSCNSRQKNI